VNDVLPNATPAVPVTEAEAHAWRILGEVPDPEIPVLSVLDLGVIRSVRAAAGGALEVAITPTYSGCPATAVIRDSVTGALVAAGFADVRTIEVLSPPWSSDWISAEGRRKLAGYGIAPPAESVSSPRALWRGPAAVGCPRCGSRSTIELSHFGSTPCKALYRCSDCREPFEYFKCI
jgi:ring-1,2-phenylacetyl-CoA epoxidase subunit PaaD